MSWDPDADALGCAYCGNRIQVPRDEGTVVVERALEEAGEAARGFGVELRVARCNTCGASVSFDESTVADRCVYCGSPSVLIQEASRNAIRPESLVPLDVGRSTAEQSFRRWIRAGWFRPRKLAAVGRVEAVGVYIPFWTFDCRVHSDWSADAGHYYWVTETYTTIENGRPVTKTRQVRKVRWVPAWGSRDDTYDDILINASRGVHAGLLGRLVDLDTGWETAKGIVTETQMRRCAGDVPGDTQRNLRVKNTLSDARWKHILLPLWTLQYRFGQKTYTVLIHGQTGRLVGQAPVSWVKILLLVLAIIVVGLIVAAIANR
jgi:DNA-directed RNA polymerase subunit RPC12/RpoP